MCTSLVPLRSASRREILQFTVRRQAPAKRRSLAIAGILRAGKEDNEKKFYVTSETPGGVSRWFD